MTNQHSQFRPLVILGIAALGAACGPTISGPEDVEVEALQMDGAWVFTYRESPDLSMHALLTGPAAVVDGCLRVGDQVVVWREQHLGTVGEITARIDEGEVVSVSLGGGGGSVGEGMMENVPEDVRDRCSLSGVWHSGHDEVAIIEGG
ncbi:MAG: hypothetical protein V4850_25595 [Myxococcota bacterium]